MKVGSINSKMTSRERVRRVLAQQEPDRVPIDYAANANIDRRLKEHYGLKVEDREGLQRALGVDAVDTLQPEAKNMSPEYLKKTFGGRLAFHGCISTAGPVSFGTVDDVVADCSKTLKIMMPGGGYCFAPTHALQDNSPTENVLAMYATVHEKGWYSG